MKNLFVKFGYDADNIVTIHNGIQLDKYEPTWEDDGHFLWSGRFHFEKGWFIFLKTAEYLEKKAKFFVTGGGTEEHIADFGKTEYLGFLPYDEYMKVLNSSRAFCMTSIWSEPCGYSQLKAQACGKPIIGFMVGGLPEYIPDGKAGLLLNLDSIEYIDTVNYLIDNPEVAHKFGKQAHENVQRFDIKKTIDEYEKLYKEMLEN